MSFLILLPLIVLFHILHIKTNQGLTEINHVNESAISEI